MRKKIKINSVRLNIILNILYTLMNTAFPIITYPYVSRVLAPSGIGIVNFFSQVASYCTMFAALGLGTYGIRATARVRKDNTKLSEVVVELMSINIALTFFVMFFYILLSVFLPQFRNNILLVAINGIAILTAPFSLDWMYTGLEQFSYITKRDFLFKVIAAILIFLFVKNKSDYVVYALILLISNLGTTVFNFIYAHEFIKFRLTVKLRYQQHFKPMLTLFASVLAVSVYSSLDTIMLGFIRGNVQVGLYTTATKIETILLALVNAISAALLPRLSVYVESRNYLKYREILNKSFSTIFIITISFCLFFTITAKECVIILGGKAYINAAFSMQLLMPILVISGFSNITGNQILIPQGKDTYFTRAVSMGALVDIIFNLLLMKKYGAVGASIATLIAEITQMSIQFYYSKSDVLPNINYKSLFKSIFSVILATIVLLIIKQYLINIPLIISLIIQATIFFGAFIILLILAQEENVKEMVNVILSKINF